MIKISEKKPSFNKSEYGFSLIELIVVIAVMAILSMLMVLGYQSFRGSVSTLQCSSNMRQIFSLMLAFAEDHDGKLPPDLGKTGESTQVDARFHQNQFWWDIAYLGRYMLKDMSRPTWSIGTIRQYEAEVYNCPNRFLDGPDKEPESQKPRVSYVMRKMYTNPKNYLYHAIENKERKLLITEGISSTLATTSAFTDDFGMRNTLRRLRRFHNGAVNILYLNGRVELYNGEDARIAEMVAH